MQPGYKEKSTYDFNFRFGRDEIYHAYGVLRVNSFAIEMASGGKGRALFPLTALISHSCQPNILHEPMADLRKTQSKSIEGIVYSIVRNVTQRKNI